MKEFLYLFKMLDLKSKEFMWRKFGCFVAHKKKRLYFL
jgi:hypothetical protein